MIFQGFIFTLALVMLIMGISGMITGPDPLWLSGFFTVSGFAIALLSARIIDYERKSRHGSKGSR